MQASVSLGLDNTPFDKAINQAQAKAESFASKVGRLLGGGGGGGKTPWEEFTAPIPGANRKIESLSGSIANLFKRTPDRRAEVALSQFAANLTSGDVSGAITSLGLRMTGFGLVAGVAIGGAIETFNRFRGQVKESDAAVRNLAETLGTFGSKGRSVESLSSHFKEVSSSVSGVLEKSDSWGAIISRLLGDLGSIGATNPEEAKNRKRAELQAELRAGLREEINTLKRRNEADFAALAVRDETLNVSERQGALDKIALDADEKRAQAKDDQLQALADTAKLAEKGVLPKGQAEKNYAAANEFFKKRVQDITADQKLSTDELNQQFDLKQQEADVEGKILALKKQGLSTEEATTSETRLRIALLREQLGTATAEQQSGLQNKITALKQTLPRDLRPPISISGETSQGILDPNSGEFRRVLRPQEQANLRAGQAEAQARMRDDQAKFESDTRDFGSKYQDYLRGADYYSKEELTRPTAPGGYDVNAVTGQVTQRAAPGSGAAKPMTKEEFAAVINAFGDRYFGQ